MARPSRRWHSRIDDGREAQNGLSPSQPSKEFSNPPILLTLGFCLNLVNPGLTVFFHGTIFMGLYISMAENTLKHDTDIILQLSIVCLEFKSNWASCICMR